MYAEGHKVKGAKLPLNLLDALRALDVSERAARASARTSSPPTSSSSRPTGTSTPALTEWERETTLDC